VAAAPEPTASVVKVALRERLGSAVPPAAPGLDEIQKALRDALAKPVARRPSRWARLLEWLNQRLRFSSPASAAAASHAPTEPAAPRRASLLDRLGAGLKRGLGRLLRASQLEGLVTRAQARYLGRMMRMFEEGNLEQALRHAISLGGGASSGPDRPALSAPKPRKDLAIQPRPAEGGGSGIGVADGLMEELRRLYRQAFERLRAQGRIDEAAFVLAELLHADEEAVSFLESHGKPRLAAEVAEARGLAPGLVVRQWFLAGEPAQAVRVARRTGAFADAVQRLEKTHPAEALELRRAWAGALAEAGNFQAAVDVVWPHEGLRAAAAPWLDALVELGGSPGAKALVRKLVLQPAAYPRLSGLAVELMEDESRERAQERQAFAQALIQEGATPELTTLARPAVRALVRDRPLFEVSKALVELDWLAAYAQDGALRADLPAIPPKRAAPRRDGAVAELSFTASDVGAVAVRDAVPLPKGRVLVALGEGGARLLNRDGRTLHHFDVPAHHLVVSTHGDRAIALARRGDAMRLSRLDLLNRRASAWCDARVDAWAADYDGSLWFMAARDAVFAVDALAGDFRAMWRVDALGGPVKAVARTPYALSFVVDGVPPERWSYELPGLVLRQRSGLEAMQGDPRDCDWRIGQSPTGKTGMVRALRQVDPLSPIRQFQLLVHEAAASRREYQFSSFGTPAAPVLDNGWLALPILHDGFVEVLLMDVQGWRVAGRFSLEGARSAAVRLWRDQLVLCDDRGRLLLYEPESQALVRSSRI
jgi:hypothetical protein